MSYECQKCGKALQSCPCESPKWVDEDGDESTYQEGINERVNRVVKNGGTITDKRDKGGFLGAGFEYCPGDPFW